jgi:hypothetical protein
MKITREKNLVELVPENDTEVRELQDLWNAIVDCSGFNKKLLPVGEYVPQKEKVARFLIEVG